MGWLRDLFSREDEIGQMFVRKGEKYMMEQTRYAGFDVPAMTPEGLKKVVGRFNKGKTNLCSDTFPAVNCDRIHCSTCILHGEVYCGGDNEARAKAFADYARAKGFETTRSGDTASQGMPEIETGMVVRLTDGRFYLCVVKNENETVLHELRKGDRGVGFVANMHRCFQGRVDILHSLITDVYYDGCSRPWLPPSLIVRIVESGGTKVACAHWHRPEEPVVKEMTVDEIEKALGYKVKVVGNEKADD